MTVPKFIGGNKLLYMFIKANLKYPKAAKKEKIQGKVLVGFVVNKKRESGKNKSTKIRRPRPRKGSIKNSNPYA